MHTLARHDVSPDWERGRCRAPRTLRKREAELERCHAIVDVFDDSAAEHLAGPCQMIGRLIMIAVRCVPRARPGPARQHMPAMSMGNIEIERDVAPAEEAYRLLEPLGSSHPRLETVFACGHFPVEYIVAMHPRSEERRVGKEGVGTCGSWWSPKY